jgi:hypothetical protein
MTRIRDDIGRVELGPQTYGALNRQPAAGMAIFDALFVRRSALCAATLRAPRSHSLDQLAEKPFHFIERESTQRLRPNVAARADT